MEFTETGQLVYDRTYARTKPDGTKEDWPETVHRVVSGNLALVDERYHEPYERDRLVAMMNEFKIIPAGRHLWASGVKGAQHLFNCWVSGWAEDPWDHFEFTFLRLMEGGGVGANYSNHFLQQYPEIHHELSVQIVCDPTHPDYQKMHDAGLLSDMYAADWAGAWEVEDSREGWAAALVDLLKTFYRDEVKHTNRVYDISRVRPSGARLKTFGGTASGPAPLAKMLIRVAEIMSAQDHQRLDGISAMEIDHALAECVVSGGVRRSARMAMMHWNDPQIFDFIGIKERTGFHWTTNISVEVDSYFWEAIRFYESLIANRVEILGPDEREARDAKMVLEAMTEGMINNGEPGFWDSSLSNRHEPNPVVCTNPCGEITLEPWEPCNLGHINLAGFVNETGGVDYSGLEEAHKLMTRFLIRATFASVNDPKSRAVLDRNRRIGVGHLGVASFLAMQGTAYSDAAHANSGAGEDFRGLLMDLAVMVDISAEEYSRQLRIPVPVKLRTVAPTGTIAKMPGVSEGIHPIFSKYFIRRIRFSAFDVAQALQVQKLMNQGYEVENDTYADNTVVVSIPTKDTLVQQVADRFGDRTAERVVEGADELSLWDLLGMQAMYQTYWADNAVSFTANIDPGHYTPEEVAMVLQHFGGQLKGATIFPEMSMPQSPYERITREEYEASTVVAVSDGIDEECVNGCPIK